MRRPYCRELGTVRNVLGDLPQRDRGERESKNSRQLAPAELWPGANALATPRATRQGRPPGLMRRAKTLTGLGVEVLIEEERISLGWIVLEAGIWAVRRPPVIRVEQKQAEQTAPERVATRSRFGRVPDPVGNSTVKSSPKKL
jgi:hypothetical protein